MVGGCLVIEPAVSLSLNFANRGTPAGVIFGSTSSLKVCSFKVFPRHFSFKPGVQEKDMLLIPYTISIVPVTSRGGIGSPGHCQCFNS